MTKKVITSISDQAVATVKLNAPEKHNAFDDATIAALQHSFDSLGSNTEIRAIVLASEGRSFSAGADLNWMKAMAGYDYQRNEADARALADMLNALYSLPQPTIAQVQGAAFGGGVGLVSCCDIAIASSAASFCLSEVKLGLIPATISPYVIRAIGERASRRYFMSAERFDAHKALELGLVSDVVEPEALTETVDALCQALCSNGPEAVRAAKLLVRDVSGGDIDEEMLAATSRRIAAIRVSAEGQEGLDAFLNKRSPGWIGE